MKDYHCALFDVDCRVPRKAFNREAFIDNIKDITPTETQRYGWGFGSKDHPQKQHASIRVSFLEDVVNLRLVYHPSNLDMEDKRPPYMEDCANWLGGFIVDEANIKSQRQAVYLFEENYTPVINLPFPLVNTADNAELIGAEVTGLALRLAGRGDTERLTIDKHKNDVLISFCGETSVNLKSFQLEQELVKLQPIITGLVKETKSV